MGSSRPSACPHRSGGKRPAVSVQRLYVQHVNGWYSRFKSWLMRFRGVAGRYLANYSGGSDYSTRANCRHRCNGCVLRYDNLDRYADNRLLNANTAKMQATKRRLAAPVR